MIPSAANPLSGIAPSWRPGRTWRDTDGPMMIDIPPGWFTMGENPGDPFAAEAERPAHEVSISAGLALSVAPVTVAELRRFRASFLTDEDPDLPAVYISWIDATEYCAWLSLKTGLPYRLPSESEWEFACRAGSIAAFTFGDELTPHLANYLHSANGAPASPGQRTAAGAYRRNAFGLHDVHGNVCEWIADAWHPNYVGAPGQGSVWNGGGDLRVVRGGAWDHLPGQMRSSHRDCLARDSRRHNVGFRIAVSLEVGE